MSWKPVIVVSLSTLGLKSIASLREITPLTEELNKGISSTETPASCR